jgi:small subunit ribosomal protein S20
MTLHCSKSAHFSQVEPKRKFFFTNRTFFVKIISVMPIIKSAIKKAKQDEKARAANRLIKANYRKASKEVRNFAVEGKMEDAHKALKAAFSTLDKAAKKKVIHKNNASRRKARLAKLFKKETQAK